MLNKNEYLLDEILKAVDDIAKDKSHDVVLDAIENLIAVEEEITEKIDDVTNSVCDIKIELAELKTMLQQIINIVSKQTVDIGKDIDNDTVNRTRKILSAYGNTTDEL